MRQRLKVLRRHARNAAVRTGMVLAGAAAVYESVSYTRVFGAAGSSYLAVYGLIYVGAGLCPGFIRFQGKR